MKTGDKIVNYCCLCLRDTNHVVLFVKEVPFDEDYAQETTYYTTVECAGCNYISYRTENIDYLHFEQNQFNEYNPSITVSAYPIALKRHRKIDKWYNLPKKISIVYEESIKAFGSGCYLLAGVAFRAVIEAICLDKKIRGRDLYAKITNLVKSKLITEKEADRLHAIRFIGNDSVHEMNVPGKDALYVVLNTIEHLLNNLYIIDGQIASRLETVIHNYSDFIKLLDSKISLLKSTDSFSLTKILGKAVRRLDNKIEEFEKELIEKIGNSQYANLAINEVLPHEDKKKADVHYYKITESYTLEKEENEKALF